MLADRDWRRRIGDPYGLMAAIAMSPDAVAQAIAYALAQSKGVNVGEIVVRSAAQP